MELSRQKNWHTDAFFGLHYDLHPSAEDTVLGRDVTFEHVYQELSKVKPDFVQYDCKGHPGYAGYPTKVGKPSPGIVGDSLKVYREVTRKLGIPLSVHYSGVWDTVAVTDHPEWAHVEKDGSRNPDMTCNNSRYTEDYMIPQMKEIIDFYDVDGFWVDGENWATAPCYCDTCQAQFRESTGITEIPHDQNQAYWDDWLEFHRQSFEHHVEKYVNAIHAYKQGCLVCSNWMYSVRQPDEVNVPVDYISGDFDWSFGVERAAAEARFLDSRGLPWDLMAWSFFTVEQGMKGWTFKTATHLCQEVAVVLANGGSVFIYSQPQRSGHIVGWQQDILAEVAAFCRDRQAVSQHTISVPQVALLHSANHFYASNQPSYNFDGGNRAMEGALHALLENGCHVDILNDETLMRRMDDYPLVVVAEQNRLSNELVAALQGYVQRGGRLLASGSHVAEALSDVCGVNPSDTLLSGQSEHDYAYLPVRGEAVTVAGPWRSVVPISAREWSPLLNDQEVTDFAGSPAVTVAQFGQGVVAAVHGPLFTHYYNSHYPRLRTFIGDLLEDLRTPALAKLTAPPRVEMSIRKQGQRLLVHLVNRGTDHPLSPRNHAVENVPEVGPIRLEIPCEQSPNQVSFAPEPQQLIWQWDAGRLTVELGSLAIHGVIVVE